MSNNLTSRIINLLEKYEYRDGEHYAPEAFAVDKLIDTSRKAKSVPVFNGKSLLEAFRSHPNYDGDGKIVLNEKHYRRVDTTTINEFGAYIEGLMRRSNRENHCNAKYKVGERMRTGSVEENQSLPGGFSAGFNFLMHEQCEKEGVIESVEPWGNKFIYLIKMDGFETKYYWDERTITRVSAETETTDTDAEEKHYFTESERMWFRHLSDLPQYLDAEETERVNTVFPFLKAHNNGRTSRIVNKICRYYGFDKDQDYASGSCYYTRFADAINPLTIQRWTILSINPIDFFTMSFGNSWTSCHSIDKTDLNGTYSGSYHGCYSGGTLSYMCDSVSFIMYTVDNAYKGTNYELQPKINRQMFHIGEDKLIQGRMYPQDNDTGAADLYKNFREIAQRVVSECFGVNNLWKNEKGTGVCGDETISHGVHYRDYTCYDNCNVSYLNRGNGAEFNHVKITIGALGVCPTCGGISRNEECILCEDCYNDERYTCPECGCRVDPEDYDVIYIDGSYYCDDRCARNAGYVLCSDGEWRREDREDVMYDDYTEEYEYDSYGYWPDSVVADGYSFTCEENAMNYGFVLTEDDGWHHPDYCHQADNGNWYYDEDNIPVDQAG